MRKNNIVFACLFMFCTGLVIGAGAIVWWGRTHSEMLPLSCQPPRPMQADFQLTPLEDASLPEGVKESQPEAPVLKSSAEIPSQLVRPELPEDIVLGAEPTATAQEGESKPAGVVLSDEQNTVVLNSQRPPQRVADGTNITMIEAPVALKRIQTLDQYKEFKRTAKGSYPEANFDKEEVIVLESTSNLPDKVFEIIAVEPDGENLKLLYRVNVFGLDKKINTHSAYKMSKTPQEISLEQVL